MTESSESNDQNPPRADAFSTTQWSMVLAASDRDHPDHAAALADLCRAYWFPVYVFVRRRVGRSEEAADLTQGFFAHLLEKQSLASVRRERGRFRSFLITAVKFYLSHERGRSRALKRGGGMTPVPIERLDAERLYGARIATESDPDALFVRQWALVLLQRATARFREKLSHSPNPERALRLAEFLSADDATPRYADLAHELGMTETAVKVSMHRLRRRFQKSLREEIRATVAEDRDVEAELSVLMQAVGAS